MIDGVQESGVRMVEIVNSLLSYPGYFMKI